MKKQTVLAATLALICVSAVSGQTTSVEQLDCLPHEGNAVITAAVRPDVGASDDVRLYFRRLSTTGAYYYVELNAAGSGNYWGVFPKPEDRDQQELSDEWWEILQSRDWLAMNDRDREWLVEWFEAQEHEAAEYYVSVVDVSGTEKSRTKTHLVPVQEQDDCSVGLTVAQHGQAQNLVIGETEEVQEGNEIFHWLCDGIVTRINPADILRPDEFCRACVVAGWFPASAAAGALIAGTTIEKREPRSTSLVQP